MFPHLRAAAAAATLAGSLVAAPLAVAAPTDTPSSTPTAASTSTSGSDECTATSGVRVVVDLGGGEPRMGCAPGDPKTGLEALEKAGFTVKRNAAGMVCQIEDVPTSCEDKPAMDSFWSYWNAEPGKGWAFAQKGADANDPLPGHVEGWRLGDGKAMPGGATAPALSEPAGTATPGATAGSTGSPSVAEDTAKQNAEQQEKTGTTSEFPLLWSILGALALVVIAGVLMSRRRRSNESPRA